MVPKPITFELEITNLAKLNINIRIKISLEHLLYRLGWIGIIGKVFQVGSGLSQ